MQGRIEDIQDVLARINSVLDWYSLSPESRQQLIVFKAELEAELRFLLSEKQPSLVAWDAA